MSAPAPAPRPPPTPAGRPLARPPARIGCSGISVVAVAAGLAFLFFRAVVAPALTGRLAAIQLPQFLPTSVPAAATPGETSLGGAVTPLAGLQLTPAPAGPTDAAAGGAPTAAGPPTATPPTAAGPQYVMVANTGGTGVYLRADPRVGAQRLLAMTEKTLLQIAGPDATVDGQVWRNVRTTGDNPQTGWVLGQYLAPAPGP